MIHGASPGGMALVIHGEVGDAHDPLALVLESGNSLVVSMRQGRVWLGGMAGPM